MKSIRAPSHTGITTKIALVAACPAMASLILVGMTLFSQQKRLIADAERLSADRAQGIAALSGQLDAEAGEMRLWVVGIAAVSGIVAVGAGIGLARSIARPIERVIGDLQGSSGQIAAAADLVSGSSQSLADGASAQAASLEETSASLEELASMTKRNAEDAATAKKLASRARHVADAGATALETLDGAMSGIKESGDEIAKIIKTIDEIAFQTNILALNAAVEAARAGEAGMGFAVVAEEVRNLAHRSAQAARETAEKIATAIHKTGQGVEISERVGKSLAEIVEEVRKVDELVGEVATASHEQSQGVDQINAAILEMDKVVQANAASAEESAGASEELNAQALMLRESISGLRRLVGGTAQRPAAPVRSGTMEASNGRSAGAKTKMVAAARPSGRSRLVGTTRPT